MNWGSWTLDAQNLLLVHPNYEVSLTDMTSSSRMLDWIFQLTPKSWLTARDLKAFLEALDDIFMPQATLCGGGQDMRISDPAACVRQYVQANQA